MASESPPEDELSSGNISVSFNIFNTDMILPGLMALRLTKSQSVSFVVPAIKPEPQVHIKQEPPQLPNFNVPSFTPMHQVASSKSVGEPTSSKPAAAIFNQGDNIHSTPVLHIIYLQQGQSVVGEIAATMTHSDKMKLDKHMSDLKMTISSLENRNKQLQGRPLDAEDRKQGKKPKGKFMANGVDADGNVVWERQKTRSFKAARARKRKAAADRAEHLAKREESEDRRDEKVIYRRSKRLQDAARAEKALAEAVLAKDTEMLD